MPKALTDADDLEPQRRNYGVRRHDSQWTSER
jgi:hypothetical protein